MIPDPPPPSPGPRPFAPPFPPLPAGAPAPAAIPDGANRRLFPRIGCDLPVLLTEVLHDGSLSDPWEARAIDISQGGCRFVSPKLVHPGTRLLVQVLSTDGRSRRGHFAVVRHSRPAARDAHHQAGVEFLAPPPGLPAVVRWLREHAD